MRWDNLFDDLESQLEQELTAEEIDLQAEEERLRLARLGIRDRVRALAAATASDDRLLRLVLADGSRATVSPATFGRDWVAGELIEESGRRPQCIVALDAIEAVILSRSQVVQSLDASVAEESAGALSARLGLQFVLRDLCRRRQAVDLWMRDGRTHGTIDRVGRDHVDLAVHEVGEPRRESAVTEYRIVRLGQIVLVRL
ncbi:MAG: hypothetical protein QOH69_652 [Actinomycetota bacterium]|jgi:hypothetical protein|nr:hypothetical protein [Actinomycetota bacterium]